MSTQTDRLTKLRNLASHPATPPAEAAAARGKIADIEAKNPDLKESAKGKQRSAFAFMSEEYIREHLERMARVNGSQASRGPNPFYPDSGWNPWEYSEQAERDTQAREETNRKWTDPPMAHYFATREAYERAMEAWLRENTNAYAKQRHNHNETPRSQPRREDYENLFEFNEAMLAWLEANRGTTSRPDPFAGWADMPDPTQAHPHYGHEDEARKRRSGEKARIVATRTYPQIAMQLHEYDIDMPPHVWEKFLYDMIQSR